MKKKTKKQNTFKHICYIFLWLTLENDPNNSNSNLSEKPYKVTGHLAQYEMFTPVVFIVFLDRFCDCRYDDKCPTKKVIHSSIILSH